MTALRIVGVALAITISTLSLDPRVAVATPEEDAVASIDAYWTEWYITSGHPYDGPEIVFGEQPGSSACRTDATVAYCASDGSIYLTVDAIDTLDYDPNDISTKTALAYAWGAWLADTQPADATGIGQDADEAAREWFAGCAAGVYIGALWFDFATGEGDVMVAVDTIGTIDARSVASSDARVLAFMTGFVVGYAGCAERA